MGKELTQIGGFERLSFKLPQINRDQQIWLGKSIIALIGINLPPYFPEHQHKEDVALMFIDIIKHFGITLEEVYKYDIIENVLDPDYAYEIKTNLSYEVLEKKRV